MVAHRVRCNTCRQRKVKCDQQWSIPGQKCGQCRKSNLPCSGPQNKLKFVVDKASTISRTASDQSSTKSAPLPSVGASGGSAPIPPVIPASHASRVGAEIIDLVTSQPKTFGFSSFAKLLTNVPAMLETSAALKWAIACLSDARKRQMFVAQSAPKVHPVLYSFALQELRRALQDPHQVERIETLMAILVMENMEASIATSAQLPKMLVVWSAHISGVGCLIKQLGPGRAKDKLIRDVLIETLPQLSAHHYAQDELFFMNSPEWHESLFERENCAMMDKLLFKVFAQISAFPDIVRDLRRYHAGKVEFESILARVQAMSDALQEVEAPIRAILEDPVLVKRRPSSSPHSPVDEVYEAETFLIPRICCFHAISSICATNMLIALVGDSDHKLKKRARTLSSRVWMFHEQAAKVGSFGMHYYPSALLLTYDSAKSDETKEWVVNFLNQLQGRNPETDSMFTHEEVIQRCLAISGRLSAGC